MANGKNTISSSINDTLYSFTAHPGGEYYYMVRGENSTWGWGDYSCLVHADVGVGACEGDGSGPMSITPSISLVQNPFNDQLGIHFTLGNVDPEAARLHIYDATGRLVSDLSSRLSAAGYQPSIMWNGCDECGKALPNGIYFVRLTAGGIEQVEKAVIVR